jgi:hypothetical protein
MCCGLFLRLHVYGSELVTYMLKLPAVGYCKRFPKLNLPDGRQKMQQRYPVCHTRRFRKLQWYAKSTGRPAYATASSIDIGVCLRQEAEAFADDAGSRPSRLLQAGRGRRGGGEAEECRRCKERAQDAVCVRSAPAPPPWLSGTSPASASSTLRQLIQRRLTPLSTQPRAALCSSRPSRHTRCRLDCRHLPWKRTRERETTLKKWMEPGALAWRKEGARNKKERKKRKGKGRKKKEREIRERKKGGKKIKEGEKKEKKINKLSMFKKLRFTNFIDQIIIGNVKKMMVDEMGIKEKLVVENITKYGW